MSKFIDKLKRISHAPQPMGFKVRGSEPDKPKMLVVVSLASADVGGLADYMAGVDSGLLRISDAISGAEALKKAFQLVPDIPWGGWLRDIGNQGMEDLVKTGCDAVVFSAADTPLALLQNDEMGRILEVDASVGDGLLRSVNKLSVDAVLIASEAGESYPLTWHHLMRFQRFSDLLSKPLLVSVPADVTGVELQALWDAGVRGVIVESDSGQPAGKIKELCQSIDKLDYSLSKREKLDALLPHIRGETDMPVVEEDEDDE